jgi:hypothetical protein
MTGNSLESTSEMLLRDRILTGENPINDVLRRPVLNRQLPNAFLSFPR